VTERDAGAIGDRRLYLCTSDRPDLESFLDACLRGGVDIVQLRDKAAEDRTVVARARVAARVCAHHGVPLIVNDRPDLALEAGADGVHVGQEDVSPARARALLGASAVVGLSTHALPELAASIDEPVDYISAGPVSPTPTKPGRPGTGAAYVTAATRSSPCPVFVTGGVTPGTVPALWAAGARRFVVVRWLTEADDPGRAARSLRAAVDRLLHG
jgi:thiamine-phosphate pyrophosphorylase